MKELNANSKKEKLTILGPNVKWETPMPYTEERKKSKSKFL